MNTTEEKAAVEKLIREMIEEACPNAIFVNTKRDLLAQKIAEFIDTRPALHPKGEEAAAIDPRDYRYGLDRRTRTIVRVFKYQGQDVRREAARWVDSHGLPEAYEYYTSSRYELAKKGLFPNTKAGNAALVEIIRNLTAPPLPEKPEPATVFNFLCPECGASNENAAFKFEVAGMGFTLCSQACLDSANAQHDERLARLLANIKTPPQPVSAEGGEAKGSRCSYCGHRSHDKECRVGVSGTTKRHIACGCHPEGAPEGEGGEDAN